MSFRIIVKQNPGQVEFEVGSVEEAIGILQDKNTSLTNLMTEFSKLPAEGAQGGGESPAIERKPRKPRNANQPDSTSAQAPAPIPPPAPGAAAPPPSDGLKIPPFLDRNAQQPAPLAPPAPPAPAPTPAPAPVVKLSDKVIANLKTRAEASPDKGAALAQWLVDSKIVVAGATFVEACAVLQFSKDEQLTPIAAALGVS
jgi:hypothetical protein